MPQPDDSTDDNTTLETGVARLPAATPALPEAGLMDEMTIPALSEEELEERQRLLGTRRKPAGPPLRGPEGVQDEALDTPADVPETEVSEAVAADQPSEDRDNDGPEPSESSERD